MKIFRALFEKLSFKYFAKNLKFKNHFEKYSFFEFYTESAGGTLFNRKS